MQRVGFGFDVHRLVSGRPLWLGGERIEFERGLEGYSDADVALHALCDSLLGAAALGDIGQHFPPTDERYRDISSLKLLARVQELLSEQGWCVVNVDLTIVCEEPKIAPHTDKMRQNIARTLNVEIGSVSLKATTTEKLGLTGRGEGIAATAVALIGQ